MKEEKSDRNFLGFYLSCKTIIPFVFPTPCFVSLRKPFWFISGDFTKEEKIGLKGQRRDNRLKTVLNCLLTTVEQLLPINKDCFSPGAERSIVLQQSRPEDLRVFSPHLCSHRRRNGRPHISSRKADSNKTGSETVIFWRTGEHGTRGEILSSFI